MKRKYRKYTKEYMMYLSETHKWENPKQWNKYINEAKAEIKFIKYRTDFLEYQSFFLEYKK